MRFPEHGPEQLPTGAVALLRGPRPYVVSDDPSTRPQVVIGPGQVCTPVFGEAMSRLGTRSWGNDADGETVLLTGTYTAPGAVGDRLVRALPELVVVSPDGGIAAVTGLLGAEMGARRPGRRRCWTDCST